MTDDNKRQEKKRFISQEPRGFGRGHGRGMGRGRRYGRRGGGRGRPPVAYPIRMHRPIYADRNVVQISSFELQILKMSDIDELTQKQIAEQLGISQTSVWRYLKTIRTKIAQAILNHNVIEVEVVD
ncbi:MAG: DUF134 domain-containing protein [Candidatus Heimdallarchaeaceae archaeon]